MTRPLIADGWGRKVKSESSSKEICQQWWTVKVGEKLLLQKYIHSHCKFGDNYFLNPKFSKISTTKFGYIQGNRNDSSIHSSPCLRMACWYSVSSRLISQQKSAASLAEPLSSPAFSSPRSAGMTMYPKARKKILCESGSPVSQYRILKEVEMPVRWTNGQILRHVLECKGESFSVLIPKNMGFQINCIGSYLAFFFFRENSVNISS